MAGTLQKMTTRTAYLVYTSLCPSEEIRGGGKQLICQRNNRSHLHSWQLFPSSFDWLSHTQLWNRSSFLSESLGNMLTSWTQQQKQAADASVLKNARIPINYREKTT
jgi:hypothetical protein